ncbi:MAG: hypothetical protein CMB80_12100 [Flammeovirgaceae bacterium]|nr:hypothetical protein [Flammeovirgaceae bacterium]MBE62374.1 hypothetical protein [Flammeovirgaceae bacterium]MBR10990.1 hypothetical protein [Rickettsiales bacterium]|tara:strand:- start:77 stop:958 length:882 start_codon:yes stop_codon:yes gene_type:complete
MLLTISISTGCSTIPLREKADSLFLITDNVDVYYDLKRPDAKYYLPYVLTEVSGLAMLKDTRILCVEDEGGRVYEYDLVTKKIINAITFSDPGDFEGVEIVNDTIYVLESDGDLYEFRYTTADYATPIKYENPLSRKNDTEGLGLNPKTGRLMISCKEEEDIKGVNAKGKTVYEFDLVTKELVKSPFYELTTKHMNDFFEANRAYDYDKDRIKFEPSGIAYNPIDGFFYLLASVGKMLIVLDDKGSIKATYPIAPRILSQPEGIVFDSKGNLLISSEGEGDRGYIIQFKPKHK